MFDKMTHDCPKWVKVTKIVLILLILLGAVLWFGAEFVSKLKAYDYIGRPEAQRDTITISGEGKVTAVPDIATISVGIQTDKKTVAEAQKENTDKMNNIIKELKALDIAAKDIETTSYNIYPQYDYIDGRSIIKGYEVNQQVAVKIRDLDKVGEVIAKAGELGANSVGGLNFTIDDPEELRQQAREKALENAKEKAEALAKISGVKLGKIVSFNEYESSPAPMYKNYGMEAFSSGMGGAVAPDIQSGSLDVIINATVVYEIK